jgi:hypothetical protein
LIDGKVYDVTLSSPLLGLFVDKDSVKEMYPPIHVEVKDDRLITGKGFWERETFNNRELKNVDKIAVHDRQSSVTST